jgi:hypothetical protein
MNRSPESPETFEQELRRLKPSAAPAEFVDRLKRSGPPPANRSRTPAPVKAPSPSPWLALAGWLRWAAPACAICLAAVLVWRGALNPGRPAAADQPIKADDVQVEETLVTSYDAVASLPDGRPMRFNVRHYVDEIRMRDHQSGVLIQKRAPRTEVVPVRYETY